MVMIIDIMTGNWICLNNLSYFQCHSSCPLHFLLPWNPVISKSFSKFSHSKVFQICSGAWTCCLRFVNFCLWTSSIILAKFFPISTTVFKQLPLLYYVCTCKWIFGVRILFFKFDMSQPTQPYLLLLRKSFFEITTSF